MLIDIMDMPRIDRGIKAPVRKHRGIRMRYPWRQMAVGDSFLVPEDFPSLVSSKTRVEQRLGIKLATQKEGNGRRFFRIA